MTFRIWASILAYLWALAVWGQGLTPCQLDDDRYNSRSAELQKIVSEDQFDRQGPPDKIDWSKVSARDEARRKRVGEILVKDVSKRLTTTQRRPSCTNMALCQTIFFKRFCGQSEPLTLVTRSQNG